MNDKLKGVLLILAGACGIVFVFNFDRLMGKNADFGWYTAVAYLTSITAILNGMRIYLRK
jgi:hypothetical protein